MMLVLRTFELVAPALIPSWRFFKTVAPSPRIEYSLDHSDWREVTRLPEHLSVLQYVGLLFWNPDWNDQLFMVSCAERIDEAPDPHSINAINRRIAGRLKANERQVLRFRLVFYFREGDQIVKSIDFESEPVRVADIL